MKDSPKTSIQPLVEKFSEAEANYNLQQLYEDLTRAKQQYKNSSRQKLTPTEKAHLRGFLCGYGPQEIAVQLNKNCKGLRVELSRGLYRYIQTLTQQSLRDWKDIVPVLEASGYRQETTDIVPFFKTTNNQLAASQNQLKLPEQIHKKVDLGEAIDPSIFYDRQRELATLQKWILSDKCRVVAILGMGGMGKTALAAKIAQQIEGKFEYIIWRSLRYSPSLTNLLADLMEFFSDSWVAVAANRAVIYECRKKQSSEAIALLEQSLHCFSPASDISGFDNIPSAIGQLVKYFQQHQCLLILDGWETLFDSQTLAGNYREGYAAYGQLLKTIGETKHKSCLLLTSSITPKEVARLSGARLPVRSLRLGGLGEAATNILRDKGLSETDKYLELIKAYNGNPLALKIVGTTIKNLFGGCIGEFLKHYPIWGDYGDRLGRQLNRCSEQEKFIIDILAAKVEPVSLAKMFLAIKEKTSRQKLLAALESLQRRSLVEAIEEDEETLFLLQPLLREYYRDR